MPELPEVETVRQELSVHILGKIIAKVTIHEKRIIKNSAPLFRTSLEGRSFTKIGRIGKLLQFIIDDEEHVLLAHLKMTGQFLYQKSGKIEAGIFPLLYASQAGGEKAAGQFREDQSKKGLEVAHTHVIIQFQDGSRLAFRDVRKFGYLQLVRLSELDKVEKRFGIDPLRDDYTLESFMKAFQRRQKSIKAILMDQQLIAGIGNIYADEICHQTGLKPKRSASKLSKKQIEELYFASSDVIHNALRNKGTTLRDFTRPDGSNGENVFHLQVYGRTGEKCHRCSVGSIKKVVHLGRGTHYCPHCQK